MRQTARITAAGGRNRGKKKHQQTNNRKHLNYVTCNHIGHGLQDTCGNKSPFCSCLTPPSAPPGLVPEGIRVLNEPPPLHPNPFHPLRTAWGHLPAASYLPCALRTRPHRVEAALFPSGPASPSPEEGILRAAATFLRTKRGGRGGCW